MYAGISRSDALLMTDKDRKTTIKQCDEWRKEDARGKAKRDEWFLKNIAKIIGKSMGGRK
jgi:hypothetical protein